MIQRTLSAKLLNEVANHADVRSWLGGEGDLDFTASISDTRNIALVTDGGGFFCERLGPGTYEAHSLFFPECRGMHSANAMVEAFRYMFTQTDCVEVVTRVPDHNDAARGFARLAGFREVFRLEHDSKTGWALSVQSIDIDRWRSRDDAVKTEGEAFHDVLKAAGKHDDHPEDEAHDRAVGAAVLMCKAGQFGKAVWSYNRWAAIAGYQPVQMESESPPIMNIGTARVALLGSVLEVV